MKSLFGKSRELEEEISSYLDTVGEACLIFKRDVSRYVKKDYEKFEAEINEILTLENRADNYQKDIKYKLYKYMLIPESRSDVFRLIASIDNVVDLIKKVTIQLSIERPDIPAFLEEDFLKLTERSIEAVEMLIKSVRAYFTEITMVNEYINKVNFYEKEVDKIEEALKRKFFSSNKVNGLAAKFHLRYFTEQIALLSDEAESIGEDLSVATIKRSL